MTKKTDPLNSLRGAYLVSAEATLAQQRLNHASMMITLYGADIHRLKELDAAYKALEEIAKQDGSYVSVENDLEYMEHWEARAEKAEAKVDALIGVLLAAQALLVNSHSSSSKAMEQFRDATKRATAALAETGEIK